MTYARTAPGRRSSVQWRTAVIKEDGILNQVATDRLTPVKKSPKDIIQARTAYHELPYKTVPTFHHTTKKATRNDHNKKSRNTWQAAFCIMCKDLKWCTSWCSGTTMARKKTELNHQYPFVNMFWIDIGDASVSDVKRPRVWHTINEEARSYSRWTMNALSDKLHRERNAVTDGI